MAEPAAGRSVGRRRLLGALAVTVLGAGAVGGAIVEDVLPGGPRLRRALGLTGSDGTVPEVAAGPVRTETVRSAARGRDVRLVVCDPPGAPGGELPVCLALHGRDGDAATFTGLGVPQFLAAAVAAGVPPFRVVAVDGGAATYWHARTPGDDPMAMLTGELPRWLAERSMPEPTSALGISMGGSGALQYARARRGRLSAAALLSPALFRGWADARTVDAYRDEADWRAHEPLLHLDDLAEVGRIGVWCGTEDPFCPAARRLATTPAVTARFPRGQHTAGFWRRVMPDAMALLGPR
ncbi:alpha/beta hydrolase family protein [Streptomyces sp. TLI_171]|uniref:alpha/beta hydrolase n=1 Tax=Streptomyces sp. TLI_171 TaxID=1938859 RepID=UPI0015D52BE7|nr:alpha/beta hydrolase-fold protein [Streptomyces sp. TLI_171]